MKTVSDVFNEICDFEKRVGLFYESIGDEVKKEYGKFFENLAEDEYRHAEIYKKLGEKAARDERVI
ncbi:MAG TPA: ferritin family protein, partial [Clostridia bacterium]|nr:ferritin family protein [Clostridia bacterium]